MTVIEAASVACKTMADGTLRVTFDVEPRHAQAAFALFGPPGSPCALARLQPAQEPVPETEQPKPERMGPLCEWAVYRCKDRQFQYWIRPVYDRVMGGNGSSWGDVTPADVGGIEAYAAHAIKVICDISTRKELDSDMAAGARFKENVMEPYRKWLAAKEVKA